MSPPITPFKNPWRSESKTPPTPFYIYSEKRLEILTREFLDSSPPGIRHHFAMKANNNPHVLQFLRSKEFGLDVVSGFELKAALRQKFSPKQIVFSGVGKTNEELELAIGKGVCCLNIESSDELRRADRISRRLQKELRIAFRVNPDVDAKTHPYIATGLHEHKFGVDFREARELYLCAKKMRYIKIVGIGFHVGSQLFDLSSLRQAGARTIDFSKLLRYESGIEISTLDVGGGLGVDYHRPDELPPFAAYGEFLSAVHREWKDFGGTEVFTECGRALVAQAGFLVSRVIQTKANVKKNFLILDASMTELIRPALYDAYHAITPWVLRTGETKVFDVVGPVCESGDFLGTARSLATPRTNELYLVSCAGAYGAVMASRYNGRPLPAEWWAPRRGAPVLSVKKEY